jgi:hypothetical protein
MYPKAGAGANMKEGTYMYNVQTYKAGTSQSDGRHDLSHNVKEQSIDQKRKPFVSIRHLTKYLDYDRMKNPLVVLFLLSLATNPQDRPDEPHTKARVSRLPPTTRQYP